MATNQLSTTAYAVLGLLNIKPFSAYELTTQLKRGWSFIWPRAERGFYNEPKKLVAAGYAKAKKEMRGRQARTIYTITPAGRKALRAWLAADSAPPQLESEALVKLGLSESATTEDVIRAMRSIRESMADLSRMGLAVGTGYIEGRGMFPQRTHLVSMFGKFMAEYAQLMAGFATWVEKEVSTWETTNDPGEFPEALDHMRDAVRVFKRYAG